MSALKEKYTKDIVPKLSEAIGAKNLFDVPSVSKVVVNMGIGIADKDVVKKCADDLAAITGQKPALIKARKSISNFKLREGMVVGAKVTLRGKMMYEFLERLINATLPRIRDFRGLPPSSFDSNGNYTFGVQEQTIFPEIDPNNVGTLQGMDITIVTTAKNKKHAFELLSMLGMPFAKK